MCFRRTSWMMALLGAAFAVPALMGLAQDPAASSQELKWRYDYNLARKEAQDKGLPLIIDFFKDDCPPCRKLEATFKDPKIAGAIAERFIPVKINGPLDKAPGSVTSFLRISAYPTIVLAAPDGKILDTVVGYLDANPLHEKMQQALASLAPPEWMVRDFQLASKWSQSGEFARAITALKTILDDGKSRPVQANAEKLLKELEQKAGERVARAKELQEKGKITDAIEGLTETLRLFPGLKATETASDLLKTLAQSPELKNQQRDKRSQELLVQAKEFYKNREYVPCWDRCELLIGTYGDLPAGQEASTIIGEIKNNPEWLQNAADTLSDRLGTVYLALADSLLKKGQPQRAEFYLQRVIQAFPGTRQAESAQIRLGQLQGTPARRVEIGSANP